MDISRHRHRSMSRPQLLFLQPCQSKHRHSMMQNKKEGSRFRFMREQGFELLYRPNDHMFVSQRTSFPPRNTSETQTACSHFPMHTQQGKLSPLCAVPSSITHSQHTPHHQSTNIHLTYYSTSQQISWRKKPSIF